MSSNQPSPAQAYIPLCVPTIQGNEWKYVKECLDTTWVSSVGAYVDKFERALAEVVQTEHAVATCSGTAALHVALLVAGIQPEDEVLVSTLSFIAPANAIRYAGAWPVFVDADPNYWQMDPEKVSGFLETQCRWRNGALFNLATGRRVRAILPVHILGHPVDIDPILELARKYELTVIEDATESLGARYKARNVGALGDIACFSFNGNKLITSGGGGMIVTNNPHWAERAKYLTTQAKDDPIEYVHNEIGFNYRLTNLQAALGLAQIEQLPSYIDAKRRIAQRYAEDLQQAPGLTCMPEASWSFSTFWLYTILVDGDRFHLDSRELLRRFEQCRIQARPLWKPLHLSAAHRGCFTTDCTVAERLQEQALSLPSSVGLTDEEQLTVLRTIGEQRSTKSVACRCAHVPTVDRLKSEIAKPVQAPDWKLTAKQDLEYHRNQFKKPYRSTEALARFITPILGNREGGEALDVGCGAGANIFYLSRVLPDYRWTGVDIAGEILFPIGAPFFAQEDLNARFVVGDFFELDKMFAHRAFDLVFSLQTLLIMPAYEPALDQLLAVTNEWLFVSGLFTDFNIDAKIEVMDYTWDVGVQGPYYYSVYGLDRFRSYCEQRGCEEFITQDFEIDMDLPRPESKGFGTYTETLTSGKRLQFTGPISLPWKFLAIRMGSRT